jgi:hypothetical protein
MNKKIKIGFNTLLSVLSVFIALVGFAVFGMEIFQDKYLGVILSVFASCIGMLMSILALTVLKQKRVGNVFISYSHKDKQFVTKLVKSLKVKRFNIIYDDEIVKIGDNIRESIDLAINKSDVVIVVISDNYINSPFPSLEMKFAIKCEKKILPILIDDVSLPDELQGIKFADFINDINYDNSLRQLIKSLISVLNTIYQQTKNEKKS